MILTIDPSERSAKHPMYLVSPTKVLQQFNLHNAMVKTKIDHEVLDWFVASAKADGWNVATVKGHQVLLLKHFELLPHQKAALESIKKTGRVTLTLPKGAGK